MNKTTVVAALAILVLMTGCQKDPIEACVDDAMASWRAKYPDQAAIDKEYVCTNPESLERILGHCDKFVPVKYKEAELGHKHAERLRCMKAATGK